MFIDCSLLTPLVLASPVLLVFAAFLPSLVEFWQIRWPQPGQQVSWLASDRLGTLMIDQPEFAQDSQTFQR